MMRIPRSVAFIACAAALAGCSVVPPQAYSYDPTHPQPKPAADPVQIAPLTNRVAELQTQLNDLRTKIAAQPDTWHRLALYGEENSLHSRLGPLQRELAQYASAR